MTACFEAWDEELRFASGQNNCGVRGKYEPATVPTLIPQRPKAAWVYKTSVRWQTP